MHRPRGAAPPPPPAGAAHSGFAGQSPHEQRSALSQHGGTAVSTGAMPCGTALRGSVTGKSIWKGEPTKLPGALTFPRNSRKPCGGTPGGCGEVRY